MRINTDTGCIFHPRCSAFIGGPPLFRNLSLCTLRFLRFPGDSAAFTFASRTQR